jgi:inner membrane protein
MQGYNHIAGGFAFTGVFVSFADVNIFAEPEYIAATCTFSLLADIDHTKSLIGKAFYPIASYLHRNFGHRTITHSLAFYFTLLAVVSGIEHIFHDSSEITLIYAFAYGSHLVFDMCTKSGIPLFYPFSKRPAVLPANPDFRISSSDFRAEAIIFTGFCLIIFLCRPLMANGFWTSYNQSFHTGEHIDREFRKSKDLLFLRFRQKDQGPDSGYLIKSSENKMIVFRVKFMEIENETTQFEKFKHTGHFLRFEQKTFFKTTEDTIKMHIASPCIKIQLQAQNGKINYYEGALLKTASEVIQEHRNDFDFWIDSPEQDQSKKQRLEVLRGEIESKQVELLAHRNAINEISSLIDNTNTERENQNTSDYRKTRIIELQRDWRKRLGELQNKALPNLTIELREIAELERQLNQKPTISANIIILKIQKNDTTRSNKSKGNPSELPNIARQ